MCDIFIAYAELDFGYAKQFHAILSAIGYSVFLAPEALDPGDDWAERIGQAERDSQLIVVVISNHSDAAYFQREEILTAIELSREHRRRVVPLYLPGTLVQAPFRHLHGIIWEEGTSLLIVAQRIERALHVSRRREGPYKVISDTVVIVTGCADLPEVFDRPTAYKLKAAIDSLGTSLTCTFLRSIVMGDIFFTNLPDHPNVISIGSSGINALTGLITGAGGNVVIRRGPDSRWQIVRAANRWALFGNRSGDTYDAVSSFRERDLPVFLGEIWSDVVR